MKTLFVTLTLFLVTGLGAVSLAESTDEASADEASAETRKPSPIAMLLESDFRPKTLRVIDERRSVWNGVEAIYAANGMQPIWTGSNAAMRRAEALISTLLDSARHGLVPNEYGTERFADAFEKRKFSRLSPDTARDATSLDVSLTTAMLAYAHDMWDGRIEPADVRSEHEVYLKKNAINAAELSKSIEKNGVQSALASLQPQHEHYRALTQRMQEALQTQARGGYTQVTNDTLKRGDRGEVVYALIKRLREGSYLHGRLPSNPADAKFDRRVEATIQLLQRASALKEDGIFGPATAAILNQTAEERIQRLANNMDRWRWLPHDLGEDYLWVNIPDFSLRVYADGEQQFEKNIEITGSDGEVVDPLTIDWTSDRILSAIQAEESDKTYFDQSLPVYITYFTAIPVARGDLRLLAHETPQVAPAQTTASVVQ